MGTYVCRYKKNKGRVNFKGCVIFAHSLLKYENFTVEFHLKFYQKFDFSFLYFVILNAVKNLAYLI